MSVDMLGAIIPKDISICLVVQEIARQIDHFSYQGRQASEFLFSIEKLVQAREAQIRFPAGWLEFDSIE